MRLCKDCVSGSGRGGRGGGFSSKSRGQSFPMSALIITEAALNQVRVLYDYCYDMAVYLCVIFLGSILVVVRLAENGCLLQQLKKNREYPYINVEEKHVYFSHIDKTRIARDVANGMLHLYNKKVKHRQYLIGKDSGGVLLRRARVQ